MKIDKLLIVLSFLTLFCGCRNHGGVFKGKEKYGLTFKHECRLPAGKPLFEVLGNSIQIIDTMLLVKHQYSNPPYYWDIYSLNNMEHLKSVLRRGRGPNEVMFAHYTGQYEKADGGIWMFLLDNNSAKFYKINLTESIRSGNDVVEQVSRIDPQKSPYFLLDDNSFLYRTKYNEKDGSVSLAKGDNSWENPTMTKKIYEGATFEDSHKLIHALYYSPKNKKVCVTPTYVNNIQIIDLEGDSDMVLSCAESDSWPSVQQNNSLESIKLYYSTTRITDDYIFLLYLNKTIAQMRDSKEVEIHVFDWSGRAVAKLSLEDSIVSFDVDMNNEVLYGLDKLSRLYAYDISGCFD